MRRMAIEVSENRIREFCEEQRIRRLAFFGSVLRDDFRADSDVDVLIEFEPGERVGFFRLARVQDELSEIIGRQVDLSTVGMLSPYLRDEVLSEAEPVYVAA